MFLILQSVYICTLAFTQAKLNTRYFNINLIPCCEKQRIYLPFQHMHGESLLMDGL